MSVFELLCNVVESHEARNSDSLQRMLEIHIFQNINFYHRQQTFVRSICPQILLFAALIKPF